MQQVRLNENEIENENKCSEYQEEVMKSLFYDQNLKLKFKIE